MLRLRSGGMGISFNPLNWLSSEGRVTGGGFQCQPGYLPLPAGASPNNLRCQSGNQPQLSADGHCYTCNESGASLIAKAAREAAQSSGWRGVATPPGTCAPGYVWNTRTGSCLAAAASAELSQHPPIAPLNACPSGWTAMAPGSQPPACSGQYQAFNLPLPDETTVTCTRCLGISPSAPFVCPSGWSTVQIPCAPGEQPLELLHRNPDGTLAACYQCLQTPASVMYAARAAQAAQAAQQQAQPGTAPDGAAPAPGGGFWSGLSTGGKVAVIGAGVAIAALIAKSSKGGGGRRSSGGFRPTKSPKITRRTSDDDDED